MRRGKARGRDDGEVMAVLWVVAAQGMGGLTGLATCASAADATGVVVVSGRSGRARLMGAVRGGQ